MNQSKPNFKQCAACRGEVDLSKPLLPDEEPPSLSGRDFISNPVQIGRLDQVRKKAARYLTRATKEDSENPHFLLSLGSTECPIDWLIREKGLGLQRMLEEGVQIADFLNGNYDWKDLCIFQDLDNSRVEPQRIKDALFALGVHAEHLRDYLPYREIAAAADLTAKDMVEIFGLHFPPNGGHLMVDGGENQYAWTAEDLIAMGFTQEDLIGAGMQYVEQLEDLEPTDKDLTMMKITDRFLDQLPFRDPPVQEVPKTRTQPEPQSQPVRRQYHEVEAEIAPTEKKRSPPMRIRKLHGLRSKN